MRARLLCWTISVCVRASDRPSPYSKACVSVRGQRLCGRTAIIVTLVNSHMFRVLIRLSMTCEESPVCGGVGGEYRTSPWMVTAHHRHTLTCQALSWSMSDGIYSDRVYGLSSH